MAETYAMAKEYGPLSNKYDDDLYKSYLKLTVYTAGKLAPYQTPQLATVKVGGDRDNPLLVRECVTSRQIMEELRQKIMETGQACERDSKLVRVCFAAVDLPPAAIVTVGAEDGVAADGNVGLAQRASDQVEQAHVRYGRVGAPRCAPLRDDIARAVSQMTVVPYCDFN